MVKVPVKDGTTGTTLVTVGGSRDVTTASPCGSPVMPIPASWIMRNSSSKLASRWVKSLPVYHADPGTATSCR